MPLSHLNSSDSSWPWVRSSTASGGSEPQARHRRNCHTASATHASSSAATAYGAMLPRPCFFFLPFQCPRKKGRAIVHVSCSVNHQPPQPPPASITNTAHIRVVCI